MSEPETNSDDDIRRLPPIETTPTILIRFTPETTAEVISLVKERIVSSKSLIIVAEEKPSPTEPTVIGLTTTHKDLLLEAQRVNLLKPTNPSETYGDVSVMEPFRVENADRFMYASDPRIFTGSDRISLCCSILDTITVLSNGESNSLSKKFDEMKITYRRELNSKSHISQRIRSLPGFLGGKKSRQSRDIMKLPDEKHSEPLRHILEENNMIDALCGITDTAAARAITKQALNPMKPFPISEIRDYFGEKVAFYFAWMNHFWFMGLFPALAAPVVLGLRNFTGHDIDTCPFTPFFGFFMFLWGVVFMKMWNREENHWAYYWGTFQSGMGGIRGTRFDTRLEFEGTFRVSPVTGLMEKFYPQWKRNLFKLLSAIVTLLMLSVAFITIIISLNLQGYIHPDHDKDRWPTAESHPFFFPAVAALSQEGAIFDTQHAIKGLLPSIIHVLVIMNLNSFYRLIAEKLTEWENHVTYNDHENSLILKRFAFEAFDAYLPLFYLAFYEKDVVKLRSELVQIFNIDMFRRLALELILPAVIKKVTALSKPKPRIDPVTGKPQPGDGDVYAPLTDESNKDEYEEFDDYLEMVIELGYLTLFASAYPFAAAISVIANSTEMRSDIVKLTRLCRRPKAERTNSIGTWKIAMNFIIWLSALTNCLIFGMSSKQLMMWIPGYFYIEADGDQEYVAGKGREVVFIMFLMERLLIVVGLVMNMSISDIPEDVEVELERTDFVLLKEASQYKSLQAKKDVNELVKSKRNLNAPTD